MIPSTCFLVSALAFVQIAKAQEAVSLEEAQNGARKLSEVYTLPADAPLKFELDNDKSRAIKGGDGGVLLVPDKRLTSAGLASVGKTIMPLGELWALKVTVEDHGAAVGKDKLRVVSLGEGNERHDLPLFLLGIAKNDQDAPELLVFGKAKEPMLHVPLQKSAAGKQSSSIEISAKKRDDTSAILTIDILGEYTADLPMVKAGE